MPGTPFGLLRQPLFLGLISFCSCFLLGLLLFFPIELVTGQIEQLAEKQGLELRITNPERLFPPGLGAEELTIANPQIPHPALQLSDLIVRPVWTSLLGDNPGIRFNFNMLQGHVSGSAARNGKVDARLVGLRIEEPLELQPPLVVAGSLDKGAFSGVLPLQGENASELQVNMSHLQINGLKKLGSSTDQLVFDQLQGKLVATGPRLKIAKLTLSGPDLNLNATGAIHLGQTPARTFVNINLTLSPQPALDPVLKDMLSLLQKPDSAGNYHLHLTGPLTNPQLK